MNANPPASLEGEPVTKPKKKRSVSVRKKRGRLACGMTIPKIVTGMVEEICVAAETKYGKDEYIDALIKHFGKHLTEAIITSRRFGVLQKVLQIQVDGGPITIREVQSETLAHDPGKNPKSQKLPKVDNEARLPGEEISLDLFTNNENKHA